jgi:hypothetical protein
MILPAPLLIAAALLMVLDAALRQWRPWRSRAGHNLIYLGAAWLPFFALPHVRPLAAMVAAAVIALGCLIDFSRMVGLSVHKRFFVPALVMAAAGFPLAAAKLGGEFSALPVLALLALVGAAGASKNPQGFLQKLCLAWLSVLVYGYLYAHAVLLLGNPVSARWGLGGPSLLAIVILLAKCADIAWVSGHRATGRERLQLLASPLGGLLGGLAVAALVPGLPGQLMAVLGLGVGIGIGFGSRAYNLIVADVTGEQERQRKGTMLFGFGLALALAHWIVVLLA